MIWEICQHGLRPGAVIWSLALSHPNLQRAKVQFTPAPEKNISNKGPENSRCVVSKWEGGECLTVQSLPQDCAESGGNGERVMHEDVSARSVLKLITDQARISIIYNIVHVPSSGKGNWAMHATQNSYQSSCKKEANEAQYT